mmetsp:Transcript_33129/g.43627  ORF Transcript_33129/g.43627 Transcript_33129/m.43627 type:complete len:189 (+) Transcript_33129:50-616(+)
MMEMSFSKNSLLRISFVLVTILPLSNTFCICSNPTSQFPVSHKKRTIFLCETTTNNSIEPHEVPKRSLTRNQFFNTLISIPLLSVFPVSPLFKVEKAYALPDCFTDCFKNCKRQAPGSEAYCRENCEDYCAQDDRRDGLSGSIDAENGEVGWLSGFGFGGTIVQGEDVPPTLQNNLGLKSSLKWQIYR